MSLLAAPSSSSSSSHTLVATPASLAWCAILCSAPLVCAVLLSLAHAAAAATEAAVNRIAVHK